MKHTNKRKTVEGPAFRVNSWFRGSMAVKVLEAQEVLGLPSEAETIRYLVTRALALEGPQIQARAMLKRLEAQLSPQELLQFMKDEEKKGLLG